MRQRPSRAALFGVLIFFSAVVAGADDDPVPKDPAGRLSYPLYRIAQTVSRGDELSAHTLRTARVALRHLDRETGLLTAIAVLEPGADHERFRRFVVASGGRVSGSADDLVRVHLPPASLETVSRAPEVRFLRLPQRPVPQEVTSEGVQTLGADEFVARTGANGAGVRVGIMDSGGFEDAQGLLGSELPEDTLFTPSTSTAPGSKPRHGTSCAEIVHDVAPGAQLVLALVSDEVDFVGAINQLEAEGVRIISASFTIPNWDAPNGRGYYAYQVDQVAARGLLWVNSAGNYSNAFLRGPATDADANGRLELKGYEMVPLHVYRGTGWASLRWDEPFGFAKEDYDLLVVTDAFRDDPRPTPDNPAVVAIGADPQTGSGYPYEAVEFESDSERDLYAVVISHGPAPNPQRGFSLWVYGDLPAELATPQGSIAPPADAKGALAVGAIDATSRELHGYSSRGPTNDGRVKPDVGGPSGVTLATSSHFSGTSAAAPHIAGVAALLLSRDPSLTLARLREMIEQATPSHGTDKNNDVGFGLVDLRLVP